MTDFLLHRLAERWPNKQSGSVVSTRALNAFDKDGASRPATSPPIGADAKRILHRDHP